MIGKDSPGVGSYNYDYNKLAKSILAGKGQGGQDFSFGAQTKFFEFTSSKKLRTEV